MNRFDESYNDVDPATGRPFSWGLPDGVWIVAIIYFLPVMATIVRTVLSIIATKAEVELELFIPVIATSALYIPALILLFRRSKFAVIWTAGIALLTLIGAVAIGTGMSEEGQLSTPVLVGLTAAVVGHGYIAYYTFALKREHILR